MKMSRTTAALILVIVACVIVAFQLGVAKATPTVEDFTMNCISKTYEIQECAG